MPAVFQGLYCSSGPRNISYKRKLSAPYCSQIASGWTTLYLDLDIFSGTLTILKSLLGRVKNFKFLFSGRHNLNASTSITSLFLTNCISTFTDSAVNENTTSSL